MFFKYLFSAILVFSFSNITTAQLEKTIHQTFEVKEKTAISFNLISDSMVVIPWAGNTILTETKVELYDASPSILAHYMDKDHRYAIEADTTGGTIQLFNVNQNRKPIVTKKGECFEQVRIRVFVPEDFTQENATKFVKGD